MSGRWASLWLESNAFSRRMGGKTWPIFWGDGLRKAVPRPLLETWHRLRNRESVGRKSSLPFTLLRPEFLKRIDYADRLVELGKIGGNGRSDFRVQHARAMICGYLLLGLGFYSHAGALKGVEPRFPFYDRRLMEYCLALPIDQRLRRGYNRYTFPKAMEGIVLPAILEHPGKANLGPNFALRLLECEKPLIEQMLFKYPGAIGPSLDVPVLRDCYEKYEADPLRARSEGTAIFYALTLNHWLRHHGFV